MSTQTTLLEGALSCAVPGNTIGLGGLIRTPGVDGGVGVGVETVVTGDGRFRAWRASSRTPTVVNVRTSAATKAIAGSRFEAGLPSARAAASRARNSGEASSLRAS